MAKLKLSGRKLCTTGRKLSVCGCGGGGGPCCNAGRPCEINLASGPWNFKTWWQLQASGSRFITPTPQTGTCVGGAFSGTYAASASLATLHPWNGTGADLDDSFEGNTCFVQAVVVRGDSVTSDDTQNTGTLSGSLTSASVTTSIATDGTFSGTSRNGGWPVQPQGAPYPGDRSLNATFTFGAVSDTSSEYGAVSYGPLQVKLLDGVASVVFKPPGSTASAYVVKEGNCVIGIGATFSNVLPVSSCSNGNGQSFNATASRISGSAAVSICSLAVGCTNGGSTCNSPTVPGAGGGGSLLDTIDGALFS